jgi:hypothetical protein
LLSTGKVARPVHLQLDQCHFFLPSIT